MADLESSVETLIGLSELEKEVGATVEELRKSSSQQREVLKQFSDGATLQGQATAQMLSGAAHLDTTTEGSTQKIKTVLADVQHTVDDRLKTVQETVVKGANAIEQRNLQHYTDLNGLVRIKLDEQKAEIKQFIEHERGQIRDIVTAVVHNMEKRLNQSIDEKTDTITAHIEQSENRLNGIINQQIQQTQRHRQTVVVFGVLLVVIGLVGLARLFQLI